MAPASDPWARLRRVVEEALSLPAAERDAWLDAACGGDLGLRREAAELIRGGAGDDDLAPLAENRRQEPVLAPGARVGGYRLVRTIASGGMGTVYEAERESPRRAVALKVMRAALCTDEASARFRYEVEVLASLRHPGIAHMYETGVHVEKGRELPWFAMELVDRARPIVAYVREKNLPLGARVQLLAEVCDAVHHGHGKGVLHRDLKPDNILVDAEGRAKVIDFGVARATDADLGARTLRTRLGEIVGTLAYMSPEQIAGDRAALDVRSDVYSLGVVLYEVVTGELPYRLDGRNLVEAARLVKEVPPARMGPEARGDLETIAQKCLAKDPDRRYASAAELAQDLRRYLAREPIAAHPPSVRYQLRMLARRHRTLVATLAGVVVVSVAAAAVSLLLLAKARRAEEAASRRGAEARALFDTLLARSVDTTARFAPRLKKLSGGAPVTLDLMEATLGDLAVLEGLAAGDPGVLRQIAWAYLHLGEVQGDPRAPNQLGDREGAAGSYRRAFAIAAALREAMPDDDDVTLLYCEALRRVEDPARSDEARARFDEALALALRLRERRPNDGAVLLAVIALEERAARALSLRGEPGAMGALRRALEHCEEAWALSPGDDPLVLATAGVRTAMAAEHARQEAWEGAQREYETATALLRDLVSARPDVAHYRGALGRVLLERGGVLGLMRRPADAEAVLEEARDIYAQLRLEDPENVTNSRMLGTAYSEMGISARDLADLADADPEERRRLLCRARDCFREAATIYAELERAGCIGQGHGLSSMLRAQYDACCQELAGE